MGSPWDPDHAPYGHADAPGCAADWRAAYEDVMGRDEAESVLGGSKTTGTPEQQARTILKVTIEILNVDAIKMAYRKLVFKVHPDHGGTDSAFKEVHAAYSLLMDMYK